MKAGTNERPAECHTGGQRAGTTETLRRAQPRRGGKRREPDPDANIDQCGL